MFITHMQSDIENIHKRLSMCQFYEYPLFATCRMNAKTNENGADSDYRVN